MINKKGCSTLLILFLFCVNVLANGQDVKFKSVSYSSSTKVFKVPVDGDNIKSSDYSNPKNWLSLPNNKITKKVDIFFIYPTAWRANGKYPISELNNHEMIKGAKYYLKYRASVFESIGNIFAPYYRQLDAFFAYQTGSQDGARKYYRGVPKTDIMASFDFYIKNFNNGRPFILLGHSQGAMMVAEILSDYMSKNPDVYKRLIASYAIGAPLTKAYYDKNVHLKPAKKFNDIGVVISYNTEAPIIDGQNPLSNPDSVTINPISWRTTDDYASKEDNIGSIYVDKNMKETVYKHIADAKINHSRGTIICSSVDRKKWSSPKKSRQYLPLGVLHENDIPLYYYNLRKNAQDRTNEYFKSLEI
jgi:hypothetical protein